MEKLIKIIKIKDRKVEIYKQAMWLIASENNLEIERIELFGKSTEDGIIELTSLITK